jgi:nitrite reductase (NO-forming)
MRPNLARSFQNPKGIFSILVALTTGLAACQRASQQQAGAPSGELPQVNAELTYAPQVPPPISRTQPARVVANLEVIEKTAELSSGVTYPFWTYNGHVPGPFLRVRVGDTLEIHLKNAEGNKTHTMDLHAVTGPGGGAPVLMANPGSETVASFKVLKPGLFVFHCAANPVPAHIASGLYGLILVEPEGGLPKVDREFYVMQSEFYTEGAVGEHGFQAYSSKKAAAETPEYVVFNGDTASLMGDGALKAKVGETVRIFFGNIGPNLVSSFHVIGESFDHVYREGGLANPEENVQTTLVPAGSASTVDFQVKVPGTYTLVDHSIFRTERGAAGLLEVEGPEAPDIYRKIK